MDEECAAALYREFGYVPSAQDGENWSVWRDLVLIVIHPFDKPRLYRRGCEGAFSEIDPLPY